jgi:hypothetical protein
MRAPLPAATRGGRPTAAAVAAMVLVVAVLVALVIGGLRHRSSGSSGVSTAVSGVPSVSATSGPTQYVLQATGRTYTVAQLRADAVALAGATSTPSGGGSPVPRAVPSSLDTLYRSPSRLLGCLRNLAGSDDAGLVSIDFARFTGGTHHAEPVLVVAFPSAASVDLYVVGRHCTTTVSDLVTFQRVSRSAS